MSQPPADPPAHFAAAELNPALERRARRLSFIGAWALRLLVRTLRFEPGSPESVLARTVGAGPYILLFWHNRLLLVPPVWERFNRGRRPPGMALTSTSRDGALIAAFLDRFGIGAVRGSATRRGSAALRELVGWLRRGHEVAITPDGSRGPCYSFKAGPIVLAQLSGSPFLPVSFEFSSAWRLKTWDRFFIPKPFSRVTIVVGEPFTVPRTRGAEEFEAARAGVEAKLRDLMREQ